jgi:hypothetical protein
MDLFSLNYCSREIFFDSGVKQISDVVVSLDGKVVNSSNIRQEMNYR